MRVIAGRSPAATPQPGVAARFALRARQVGNSLELSWSPSDPLVREADHGHLLITDGAAHDQVWLGLPGLKAGRFVYVPTTRSVDFRLELYSMLRNQKLGVGVQGVVRARTEAARSEPRRGGSPVAAAVRVPGPTPAKSRGSEIRRGQADRPVRVAPAHFERLASASTAVVLAEPPAVHPAPLAATAPPVNTRPDVPQPSRSATITSDPVPPSRWREILHRVPGLRAISRWRARRQPGYVPARPLSEQPPVVPRDLSLAQPETVHVLARIESDGRVSEIQYDDGANRRLGELAADAVSRWHFSPALFNNAPVASELLLHFKFPAVSR